MKIPILSLLFSLLLVLLSTYENICTTLVAENSSLKTIELLLEKKSSDKSLDDNYILFSHSGDNSLVLKYIDKYKQTFYNFKSTHKLYRPPIFNI